MDALDELAAKRAANGKLPEPAAIELVGFADLLDPDLTSRSLVKGLLDSTALALVIGEAGCGKTFLVLDLALSIAAGRDWFDRRVRLGRAVYLAAEAGQSIRNRVAGWARERWANGPYIDFAAVVSPVDLCHLNMGHVDKLVEAIGEAALVVVDTVSRALAGGNENGPEDMGAFVTALDQLRARLGCTIIAVHHVGKDASRGGRGHSLLHCAVDTEIAVERRDEYVSVATVTKQRDGPDGVEIAFRLRQVTLGTDQDGDAVTTCVCEPEAFVPRKEKKLTGQAKQALDALHIAMAQKGETITTGEFGFTAVRLDVWREFAQQYMPCETNNAFKKAWSNSRNKLIDQGYVAFRKEYFWPLHPDPLGDVPF
jgi:hypothetical protein